MADDTPKKKLGLAKRTVLTAMVFGGAALGLGLKGEADAKKQYSDSQPPSADIEAAEQHTKNSTVWWAVGGAAAALANAAAEKMRRNKASQPKRKSVPLGHPDHPDHERVRWQEYHAEQERIRAEERDRNI